MEGTVEEISQRVWQKDKELVGREKRMNIRLTVQEIKNLYGT